MQFFDVKTLSLVALATSLLLPLVLLAMGAVTTQNDATRSWTRGAFLYGIGFVLLALRGVAPDALTYLAGNVILFAGYGELLTGMRHFLGRSTDRRGIWAVMGLLAGALVWRTLIEPSQGQRVFYTSAALLWACAAIVYEVYRKEPQTAEGSSAVANGASSELVLMRVLGSFFALTGILMGLRLAYFYGVDAVSGMNQMHSALYELAFLSAILVNFALASILPILVSGRIQRSLSASEGLLLQAQRQSGLGAALAYAGQPVMEPNAVVMSIFGFGEGEALTVQMWKAAVHLDDRLSVEADFESFDQGGAAPAPREYRIVRASDGAVRWVRSEGQVRASQGRQSAALMLTVRDITELKEAELSARAAARAAEEANRAKSRFLANMSHEIRTPMNGIIGLTSIALQSDLTSSQRDLLEKSNESARALMGIVNDLLDFSKIEAGKVQIECIPFELRKVVGQIESLFAPAASGKGLDFSASVDPSLPKILGGDPLRLSQVISNLVGNAVKFTESGSVALCVGRVGAGSHEGEVGQEGKLLLRFEVRDTGIGISEEQQARLFQPFVQADGSTTRRFGGTGLGLAISRRLSELLGGSLGLDSQAGSGAVFFAELPFAELPETAMDSVPGSSSSSSSSSVGIEGVRVLLAEDNAINVMVAQGLLEERGALVFVAADGQAAIDMLEADPEGYDIIFMDVQMPVLDGREATEMIRRQARFASLPIVAMTADAMPEDREKCLACGMNDYISKPIEAAELFAVAERWCRTD